MKKRISLISCLIYLLVLLGGQSLPVFAAGSYADEIGFLQDIGVVEEGYDAGAEMTLGEFNTILGNVLAVPGADILADRSILTAGYDPEEVLNYETGVRAAVVISGREKMAEYAGNDNKAFISVAVQAGILKNVAAAEGDILSKGDAARIIYNTIDIDLLQIEYTGEASYETTEGETILTEYLDIFDAEGIVNAVENVALYGASEVGRGMALVGEEEFYLNGWNGFDYLGYAVKVYYREEDNSNEKYIVSIELQNKNDILEIAAEDIDDYTAESGYQYFEGTRVRTARLAAEPEVVYNFAKAASSEMQNVNFLPAEGKVKLVDNGGDGRYDVVMIEDYRDYVAAGVSVTNEMIYTKFGGGSIRLADVGSEDSQISIMDKAGNPVDFSEIKDGNTVSIYKSADGSVRRVRVSSDTVQARLNSVLSEYQIMGDDMIIDISQTSAFITTDKLKIGESYTFSLNFAGKIVAQTVAGSSDNIKYGYLISVVNSMDENDSILFRLYSVDDQTALTLTAADKVKVDDTSYRIDALWNEVQGKKNTLVRYQLNAEGDLRYIDFPVDNNNSLKKADDGLQLIFKSPLKNENGARQGFYLQKDGGMMFHRSVMNTADVDASGNYKLSNWVDGFSTDSNTKFLFVPGDRKDYESYRLKTAEELNAGEIVIDAYRVGNDADIPSVVVTYSGDGREEEGGGQVENDTDGITNETPITLIESIETVLNSDDEPVDKVVAYSKNGKIELTVKNDTLLPSMGVTPGSIIRYATNSRGEIKGVEVLLTMDQVEDMSTYTPVAGNSLSVFWTNFGVAYQKYVNAVGITRDINNNPEENMNLVYGNAFKMVYVYNIQSETVETANASRIYDYRSTGSIDTASKIFTYSRTGTPQIMVIYNNE